MLRGAINLRSETRDDRLLVPAPSEAFKLPPLLDRAIANLTALAPKHLTPSEDAVRDESQLETEGHLAQARFRDAGLFSETPQDALKGLHRGR